LKANKKVISTVSLFIEQPSYIDMYRITHIDMYRITHIDMYRITHIDMYRITHIDMYRITHISVYSCTVSHTLTCTISHTLTCSVSHTLTCTVSHTLTCTVSLTFLCTVVLYHTHWHVPYHISSLYCSRWLLVFKFFAWVSQVWSPIPVNPAVFLKQFFLMSEPWSKKLNTQLLAFKSSSIVQLWFVPRRFLYPTFKVAMLPYLLGELIPKLNKSV